jgi:Invasion associated locus B (IalB) protein
MRIHRRWQIALPLLLGAVLVVPAKAQQPPEPADTVAPTPAKPAPAKKPAKPKTAPAKPAETAPAKPAKPAEAAPAKPAKPAKPAEAAPAKPATPPNVGGVKPTLLGQYGEWGAYTASPGGKKVCFAIAKPTSSQTNPPDRPRNPIYMFISTRPAEKVSNEVSIIIGYPFKPGTEASAAVGATSYALYTQQDGAWIKNAAEEALMVDAMRAGQSAVVKGVSAKGTQSSDTFSLKGLAQALDRVGQECK